MRVMAQKSWAQGEPLQPMELPTPEPRAGELRVRVRAIGVNPVDWKMRARGPLRLAARVLGPPPPVVFGVDFAGIVDAVGAGVTIRVGDAVVGGTDFSRKQRGSYADTVVVREDQIAALPAGFDMLVAGALPVAGVTAYLCIAEVGRLQPGQRALVLGASGGVGQLAVQFARQQGGSAVGVCSTRNLDRVRALGAEHVLDYTQGDPLEQARALAPFQVVVDCVGGYAGSACRGLLGPGGRHIMIAAEGLIETLNIMVPPFTSRSVLGRPNATRLRAVVDAVASGAVKVHIAETMPLLAAERALALSHAGRMTGKLVLVP
jgi:NADPH:quinone reductase-like Zn-dependent oxidoreductase